MEMGAAKQALQNNRQQVHSGPVFSKEDFFAQASHELRTPVTGIKAYTDLLAQLTMDSNHELHAIAVKLNAQVDRLMELITTMTEVAGVVHGELQLHAEPLDVQECIRQVVSEHQLRNRHHRFEVTGPESLVISADRKLLGQVLGHLVGNACKFSPSASMVTVVTEDLEGEIRISVSDSGIGVLPEERDFLFNLFFKGESSKTYPGFGIGLFLVREIVKAHGGTVGCKNRTGMGTVFYFTLPK
jgi:signal transduction histidine kinase